MRTAALLGAYLMIGSGAAIATYGVTQLPAPDNSLPSIQRVQATPGPSRWIERYTALVALSAHNAYENERR